MTQYTPMIQQYLSIKAEYEDAFLLFRLGDFYELFFEDAISASKELEITLTGRAGGTNERIPMCGVPYHSSHQYIKKLIDKGFKVAICEQVEDPKQAQGVVKREVVRVITPGTIVDEYLLQDRENNYILFLSKHSATFALVACDLSTGEVRGTVVESLLHLIDEISQYKTAEIVTGETEFTQDERMELSERFTPYLKVVNNKYNRTSDITLKQLEEGYETALVDSLPIQLGLQLMLGYLQETQKKAIQHLKPFDYYETSSFLKLDSFSRRNLEITETIREHSKKGSLLWLLDDTSTAMGGRLIKQWLQRPLLRRREIEERLQAVSSFIQHSFEREELSQALKEVYDLERLAVRVSYGNVNPRDLVQLRKSLQKIPAIQALLQHFSESYIHERVEGLDPCQDLTDLLEQALTEEPPISIKEGGIFRKGYDDELDQLLEASRNGKQWIVELEAAERERTGIKSLKVGYNKVFGYFIELTKSNIHLLHDDRYERKQTLANAERYITPELKEKEALILDSNDRLMDVEHQLFLELRAKVDQYTKRLQKLALVIAELDVLCSFARVSENHRFVRPSFSLDGTLAIKQGRHPVVERVLKNGQFVANDLMMDNTQRQILLITGPNMAGKSTYMRQVALISIMAQVGCFVPADEAILPIYDMIFTRIGAADDLVGGQSTFMVEMMETKQAITQATSNSLILLDEIGRGTSTYDGMSLAQAVVEYIHDHVQAKTLFSTHYHELTDLEKHLEKLQNVHVACSEKNGRVIFLHTVKEGKADRSYGIHVAELAELPNEVITRAKQILNQLEGEQKVLQTHMSNSPSKQEVAATKEIYIDNHNEQKHEGNVEAKESPIQLSLFEADERMNYLKEIENLNLVMMTPLEALNELFKLQQKLKG